MRAEYYVAGSCAVVEMVGMGELRVPELLYSNGPGKAMRFRQDLEFVG